MGTTGIEWWTVGSEFVKIVWFMGNCILQYAGETFTTNSFNLAKTTHSPTGIYYIRKWIYIIYTSYIFSHSIYLALMWQHRLQTIIYCECIYSLIHNGLTPTKMNKARKVIDDSYVKEDIRITPISSISLQRTLLASQAQPLALRTSRLRHCHIHFAHELTSQSHTRCNLEPRLDSTRGIRA